MRKLSNLFILAVAVLSFVSCANDTATNESVVIKDVESTRGVETIELQGVQVSILKKDIIQLAKKENASQAEGVATNIMKNLTVAENEAMLLDVNFTMEDEPVSDLFVFGIETEEEKDLTFEMYDEEGFDLAANNTIKITQGHNYKALNVKSLEEGRYYFKLKDASGKELTRKVEVQH